MSNYKEMSNNQIMGELIVLKEQHKAVKERIYKALDDLEDTERKYKEASEVLEQRIKGKGHG